MTTDKLIEHEITNDVIGAFYEVYKGLGYGFLEYVYSLALEEELLARGRSVEREVPMPIIYKGREITTQRVDVIVDRKVVVEIKATEVLPPTAKRQTLNYIRATSLTPSSLRPRCQVLPLGALCSPKAIRGFRIVR